MDSDRGRRDCLSLEGGRRSALATPTLVAHDGPCLIDEDYDGDFCCPIGEAEDDQT